MSDSNSFQALFYNIEDLHEIKILEGCNTSGFYEDTAFNVVSIVRGLANDSTQNNDICMDDTFHSPVFNLSGIRKENYIPDVYGIVFYLSKNNTVYADDNGILIAVFSNNSKDF